MDLYFQRMAYKQCQHCIGVAYSGSDYYIGLITHTSKRVAFSCPALNLSHTKKISHGRGIGPCPRWRAAANKNATGAVRAPRGRRARKNGSPPLERPVAVRVNPPRCIQRIGESELPQHLFAPRIQDSKIPRTKEPRS